MDHDTNVIVAKGVDIRIAVAVDDRIGHNPV
jgi:hypothetical protein